MIVSASSGEQEIAAIIPSLPSRSDMALPRTTTSSTVSWTVSFTASCLEPDPEEENGCLTDGVTNDSVSLDFYGDEGVEQRNLKDRQGWNHNSDGPHFTEGIPLNLREETVTLDE